MIIMIIIIILIIVMIIVKLGSVRMISPQDFLLSAVTLISLLVALLILTLHLAFSLISCCSLVSPRSGPSQAFSPAAPGPLVVQAGLSGLSELIKQSIYQEISRYKLKESVFPCAFFIVKLTLVWPSTRSYGGAT